MDNRVNNWSVSATRNRIQGVRIETITLGIDEPLGMRWGVAL